MLEEHKKNKFVDGIEIGFNDKQLFARKLTQHAEKRYVIEVSAFVWLSRATRKRSFLHGGTLDSRGKPEAKKRHISG